MSLVELATRRRVTVAMGAVVVVLFGTISLLSELGVTLLPDLSYPTLTVRTDLEGAAPAEVETLITEPIEEALGVVDGVAQVRSVSRTGRSDVTLAFRWGTDMGRASLDVRERLEVLELPDDAGRPLLLRFDPSSEPIMRLGLSSAGAGASDIERLKALRRHADEHIKQGLEATPGVAAVKISGGLEDEIQIALDHRRLSRLNLSAEDIAEHLRQHNVTLSGGRIEQGRQRYLVRAVNEFRSLEAMQELIVATPQGRSLELGELATVRHGYREREAIIRLNGDEAVEAAVYKEGEANTVRVAESVQQRLEDLRDGLPEGVELAVVDDRSVFIEQAIDSVIQAAVLGGLLAIVVLYLFLRQAWSTFVIAMAIPVSILATFFLMDLGGLSLNIMSLGGIALAIGLLVDNAIVVLENIARHRQGGDDAHAAAVNGAGEVAQAIVASTLTTLAVFVPLIFVRGIGGQLFADQAMTVTFALAASLLVALTVIPMLASLSARSPESFPDDDAAAALREPRTRVGLLARRLRLFLTVRVPGAVVGLLRTAARDFASVMHWAWRPAVAAFGSGYDAVARGYDRLLPWALRHRAAVVGLAVVALGASAALIPRLGIELIPQLSQGQIQLELRLPPGTPIEETDRIVRGIQAHAAELPSVGRVYAVAGTGNRLDADPVNAGEHVARALVAIEGDRAAEAEIVAALRSYARDIPGLEAQFSRPELFSLERPLAVEIAGHDLRQLRRISAQVADRLASSDRFVDIESSMEVGHPELRIRFDQQRIVKLGLTVRDVVDPVINNVRGIVASQYSWRDRELDIRVRAQEQYRNSLEAIRELTVNPDSARPLPLASLADIRVVEGPAEIRRADQERIAVVSADLGYGDLGAAIDTARERLAGMPLPPRMRMSIGGQREALEVSMGSLQFALALAVFLVYLVMASLFESFLHPFVILLSVPLAVVGAVLGLWLTATPISVIVLIGAIMLAGIVVNNAIVLVDLINQFRSRGMAADDAIVEGARSRLRPIAMTTLTTVLGLLPMALALGEGAELRAPLAITVIGGLLGASLLTLVVIPVLYSLVDRRGRRWVAQPSTESR